MVPLLVILTIVGFVVADSLVLHFQKHPLKLVKFNPATNGIVDFNGGLSMADGGEPLETEEEQRTGKKAE